MRIALALVLLSVLLSLACANVIARKYEYEEEVFLDLDGSATVYVNASVPALVALRGFKLPLDPNARLDRALVRDLYTTPATTVESVTLSRREGRRYVHLRLDVPDIRKLGEASPFAWSEYRYLEGDNSFEFAQQMNDAAGADVGNVGWAGDELVAVRVHLPSVITFHNSPTRKVERGNIVVWEQPLADRLRGVPLVLEVRMQPQSILYSTLILFAAMFGIVAVLFVGVIWWLVRKGRGAAASASSAPSASSK